MKEAKINTNTELKAVHEELTVPHMKFTSNEIAKLDNDILIRYRKILEGNPRVNFYPVPILNPFSRILSLSVSKSKELSEAIMQTVLAYMIQAELLHREREKSTEGEIRKLLERLEKLEQEVEEKKSTS